MGAHKGKMWRCDFGQFSCDVVTFPIIKVTWRVTSLTFGSKNVTFESDYGDVCIASRVTLWRPEVPLCTPNYAIAGAEGAGHNMTAS